MTDDERVGTDQEWCKAWSDWAFSRKRGKLAQFIIRHLSMRRYASWIDVKSGKFEVSDWQILAKIWYNEKERASEEMDATSIFRKGLTKAFPNLQEIKSLSVKEGTQYKSRVFEATKELIDEVYKYVMNPSIRTASISDYISCSYSNTICVDPVIFTTEHQITPGYNQNPHFQVQHYPNYIPNPIAYTDPSKASQLDQFYIHQQATHQQAQLQNAQVLPMQFPQFIQQQNFTQISDSIQSVNPVPTAIPSSISGHTDQDQIVPSHHYPLGTNSSGYSVVDEHASPPNSNLYSNMHSSYVSPDPYQIDIKSSPPDMDRPSSGHSPGLPVPSYDSYKMLNSPLSEVHDLDGSYQHQLQEQQSAPIHDLEIRITPNHSNIQGGGDLCIVFLQHNVPNGEKYLYYESLFSCHLTPVTLYAAGAIFAKIPPHPRCERIKLHVLLAESQTKIASADFVYTDDSYNPYTYQVLSQLSDRLNNYTPYKDISNDFYQSNVSGGSGGGSNYYYQPDYSNSYKLLVMAAGLGLEPLLYTLLQNKSFHQMLLMPSPAGMLPEDYAVKYGHYKISSCLSLLRKNYEKANGLDKDESEDTTETGDTTSKLGEHTHIRANPLDLLDKGGNNPQEATNAIMQYLNKVMDPKTAKPTTATTTPATTTPANTNATTSTIKTEKLETSRSLSLEEIRIKPHISKNIASKSESGSSPSLEKKRYSFGQKESYVRDSGIGSVENSSREGTSIDSDSVQAEITLLQGLKKSHKFNIGGITSVNYQKADKMNDTDTMDLLNREIDSLKRQVSPIVITAASAEMETTIKIEPAKQLHMPVITESRDVQLTSTERGLGYSIIGGNITGVFVNRIDNSKMPLNPGDQILSINNLNILELSGYEVLMILNKSYPSYNLTLAQNHYRYSKTMSQAENWDSFFVKSNFTVSSSEIDGSSVFHVVNSLYSNETWLAWKLGDQGREFKLSEIPNLSKAKQYGRINQDQDHYTKIKKTKVPKARPVVLLGPMADELKKNLTSNYKERFTHVETIGQVALREMFEKTSHPVSAAKRQVEFPDPSTYPIFINCKHAPSSRMPNTRSSSMIPGDSDSPRGFGAHENEITVEGSSVKEFSLKVAELTSREQNTPVWTPMMFCST